MRTPPQQCGGPGGVPLGLLYTPGSQLWVLARPETLVKASVMLKQRLTYRLGLLEAGDLSKTRGGSAVGIGILTLTTSGGAILGAASSEQLEPYH